MIASICLVVAALQQAPSIFQSVDGTAASSLTMDFFNEAGLPKALNEKLLTRTERYDPKDRAGNLKRWTDVGTLSKATFAKLPAAKKTELRMKAYRSAGIQCLRFAEIHQLLATPREQQYAINKIFNDYNQNSMDSGMMRDPINGQRDMMTRTLKFGQDLRGALTPAQRGKLAKFLGGEAYLTAFGGGGGVLYGGGFWYDGGLSEPLIRSALGIPAARSKEIGDTYMATARTDGTKANRYLFDVEKTLSPAQRSRLQELRWQAKGAISILQGSVAAKLGVSVKQIEDMTAANIALSASRRRTQPQRAQDPASARASVREQAMYEVQTMNLVDQNILSKLTPAQRGAWTKMQGKRVPGITRNEVVSRIR